MNERTLHGLTAPPLARRRWLRRFMLLLIFICGVVVGAVSGGLWMRDRMISMIQHPEQVPDRVLPRIRSELSLSEEQAIRVEEIVRRRHSAMESLRAETYPKQLAEFKAMQSEVAEVLTPEQGRKWSSWSGSIEQRYLPVRPVGPPPADLIFQRFDANHDLALTEDELPPGMWRRLRTADKNGDGKVTRQEYFDALPKGNSE